MPRFRRRPIIVEAEQFDPDKKPWPRGVYAKGHPEIVYFVDMLGGGRNPHRLIPARYWIVEGENGPMSPEEFRATYEPVPQGVGMGAGMRKERTLTNTGPARREDKE